MTTSLSPLAEYALAKAADPLGFYQHGSAGFGGMSPPQRALFADPSPKRFVIKGNKIGLTYHAGFEAWLWMLGEHPVHPVKAPNVGLIVMPDLEQSYADDVCRVLRELEPPGILHPRCKYTAEDGYTLGAKRGLKLRNGSRVLFRSSHQQPQRLEGIKAAWIIPNEPPAQHIWGGIMRTAAMGARTPVLMPFTVVDDIRKTRSSHAWLRKIVEDDHGGWSTHVVPLSPENAPHRAPLHCPGGSACTLLGGTCGVMDCSIRQQWIDCLEQERPQRIFAEWEAPAFDRIFQTFDRDRNVVGDESVPVDHPVSIGWGIDHGERPGHEVASLFLFWGRTNASRTVLVLDEYESKGRTTEVQDVLAMHEIMARYGISDYEVDHARGDTNSAGKSRLTSVNRAFENAWADMVKDDSPPFAILPARKGQGSIMYRVRVLSRALREGRLLFHERCERHIECYSRWKGDDDDSKHFIDADGYGVTELLDVAVGDAGPELRMG